MRHDALGIVEALPVDVGGRFAFQVCFDFIPPTVSTEQARRNFEMGTYARNARVPRPSPALAATVLQAADLAFPPAEEAFNNSTMRLREARSLLGLALQDTEGTPSSADAVTRCGAFEFHGSTAFAHDGGQAGNPLAASPAPEVP